MDAEPIERQGAITWHFSPHSALLNVGSAERRAGDDVFGAGARAAALLRRLHVPLPVARSDALPLTHGRRGPRAVPRRTGRSRIEKAVPSFDRGRAALSLKPPRQSALQALDEASAGSGRRPSWNRTSSSNLVAD